MCLIAEVGSIDLLIDEEMTNTPRHEFRLDIHAICSVSPLSESHGTSHSDSRDNCFVTDNQSEVSQYDMHEVCS